MIVLVFFMANSWRTKLVVNNHEWFPGGEFVFHVAASRLALYSTSIQAL